MPNQQPEAKIEAAKPDNDEVMQLLGDIHTQNKTMMQKFDGMEAAVSRRASVAGAMAGAFTGGVGGTVVSIGIELIKAKWGG